MIIVDKDLKQALTDCRLGIEPFDESSVQPASIDLKLGTTFMVCDEHAIVSPADKVFPQFRTVEIPPEGAIALKPGQFMLGTTLEYVAVGGTLVGQLNGKSSLGRCGLMIHSTAGFIDPGFHGTITLELLNVASWTILLKPGMFIGQLVLFAGSSPVEKLYGDPTLNSHYQGQKSVTGPLS